MLLRPTWWERYKWATLVVAGAGALGAIFAAGSGEGLEEGHRKGLLVNALFVDIAN